jgi:Tetracyclin repressor-like, C-terminal domain
LAEEGFAMMYRHLQQTLAETSLEPLQKLQQLGVAYILYATSQPTHYRVMFGSFAVDRCSYPELNATAYKSFDLLLQSVRECQEARLICDDNPQKIAQMLWSLTHGLSMLIIDGQLGNIETGTVLEMATFVTKKSVEGLMIK